MRATESFTIIAACLTSLTVAAAPNVAPDVTHRATADHVTVELVSETAQLKPGTRAWVGIKFTHDPHWHTYWTNPGDSGLPTRLEWQLPKGFRAGSIAWPAPQRFASDELYNFGYDGTVLLPVPIDLPADAPLNSSTPLNVTAKWLICNDVCIPGKATLRITRPVSADTPAIDTHAAALFAAARAATPVMANWQGQATVAGDRVRIELRGANLPSPTSLDVFASATKLLSNSPAQFSQSGDRLVVDAQKSDYFEAAPSNLSLVLTQRATGLERPRVWQVDIPWIAKQVVTAK